MQTDGAESVMGYGYYSISSNLVSLWGNELIKHQGNHAGHGVKVRKLHRLKK